MCNTKAPICDMLFSLVQYIESKIMIIIQRLLCVQHKAIPICGRLLPNQFTRDFPSSTYTEIELIKLMEVFLCATHKAPSTKLINLCGEVNSLCVAICEVRHT